MRSIRPELHWPTAPLPQLGCANMTEDIGSDAAKRPQAVEIAILKERIREAARRDEALIKAQAEMVKSVNEILLMMRDGNARMGAIETLQEDTTNRLVILE